MMATLRTPDSAVWA